MCARKENTSVFMYSEQSSISVKGDAKSKTITWIAVLNLLFDGPSIEYSGTITIPQHKQNEKFSKLNVLINNKIGKEAKVLKLPSSNPLEVVKLREKYLSTKGTIAK
jgi:hypothetical protein